MKTLYGFLAGFGVLGVIMSFALAGLVFVATVYGLWLAFKASIILGLIVLILQPSPAIIGLVALFFHKDLAQMVVDFLNK